MVCSLTAFILSVGYLNIVCSSTLHIGTISYFENITNVAHKEWLLGFKEEHTSIYLKPLCASVITGTLVLPLEEEIYWFSGEGKLLLEDSSNYLNCVYMTVTGAEVNHQYVTSLLLVTVYLSCFVSYRTRQIR